MNVPTNSWRLSTSCRVTSSKSNFFCELPVMLLCWTLLVFMCSMLFVCIAHSGITKGDQRHGARFNGCTPFLVYLITVIDFVKKILGATKILGGNVSITDT